jgi:anaerobic selenocysteine-containing dehydrogenase
MCLACLRREKQPISQIHPDDAARRGIGDGDPVSVSNLQGSVCLIAEVTDHLIGRDRALAPGLWWPKLSPDPAQHQPGRCRLDETDMGAGACFYDLSVWVTRLEEPEGGA